MGCNCKNKNNDMGKKVKQTTPLNVTSVVPITLNEVLTIENMLGDINTNAAKRAVITEFVRNQFGEVLMNYCDLNCQSRLKDRIQKLKQDLR